MIHSEINSQKCDETWKDNTLFNKYMKDQIHEIEKFLRSIPSEYDRNQMAILWIEEHADQFRVAWKSDH